MGPLSSHVVATPRGSRRAPQFVVGILEVGARVETPAVEAEGKHALLLGLFLTEQNGLALFTCQG